VIFGLGAAVHRLVGVRKLQAAGPPWASGSELESADYASSGQNLQVFGRGFNSPRLTSTILTEFIVLTRPLYRLSRKSATPPEALKRFGCARADIVTASPDFSETRGSPRMRRARDAFEPIAAAIQAVASTNRSG